MRFQPQRKPVFATFYSYKGGVGRTMCLLNVACILAGRGRRVLMIDFDLEAPGLTFLAKNKLGIIPEAGLVEMIRDALISAKESPLFNEADKRPFFEKYVRSLPIPDYLKRMDNGCLDLLPCGKLDDTYENRLYTIKFDQLYEKGVGEPLFKHFKKFILESERYDYILIDSRTGLSDEGGICTRDLADHIFLLMGLNQQNVEGTLRFLRSLKASGWNEGRVIFIASPVPMGYEELRKRRIDEIEKRMKEIGYAENIELTIPYHPRIALNENPYDFVWTETDLYSSYVNVHLKLRNLIKDTPVEFAKELIGDIQEGRYEIALEKIREISQESLDVAVDYLGFIIETLAERIPNFQKTIDPFYQLWVSLSDDPHAFYKYGLSLLSKSDYDQAEYCFSQSIIGFLKTENTDRVALSEMMLGNLYNRRSEFDKALESYMKALEIYHNNGDKYGAANISLELGNLYANQGNYDKSKVSYQIALEIYVKLDRQNDIGDVQLNIGNLMLIQGDYEYARNYYEEVLKIYEETGNKRGVAQVFNNFGNIFQYEKEYSKAKDYYEKSLKINEEVDNRSGTAINLISISEIYIFEGKIESLLNEYLPMHWDFIQRYAISYDKMNAYLLRAKAKAAIGDVDGAKADALVAHDFYQSHDIRTAQAEEAATLAQTGKLKEENSV